VSEHALAALFEGSVDAKLTNAESFDTGGIAGRAAIFGNDQRDLLPCE
jgi:hypothetical protein